MIDDQHATPCTVVILVELVDEIPPNITVVITSAALTLYVEKEKDSWSEYHPSVLECIQQISNCLAVCPESMSHVWNCVALSHTLTMPLT